MTARIQIALLTASTAVAIINAATREVLAVQNDATGPVELDIHSGSCPLVVELQTSRPEFALVQVGQVLPGALLPDALHAILTPSPMGTAAFVGQAPSLGASVLLEDVATVFKFGFGDQVRLGTSAIVGTVDGRSDYRNGDTRYYVKFNDKDGMPQEDWFYEASLSHTGDAEEVETERTA